MALREFWINVRTGARLIGPTVDVDSSRLSAESLENTIRNATIWLSPSVVSGFDETDFPWLPEKERKRLGSLVSEFRDLASRVAPTEPASPETIERASSLFRDIVKSLEFDRYGDVVAFQIGKRIEQEIKRYEPPELASIHFRTGRDHSGDPALWIRVILTDEASATDEEFLKNTRRLKDLIVPIARRIEPRRWPYLSFSSVTEEAELVENA